MSNLRPTLVIALTALTAACGQPDEAQPPQPVEPSPSATSAAPPPVGYACESGQTVEVLYPDASTARITYKGRSYTLRNVVSASGARYAGEGLEWWSAARGPQETATLSRLGPDDDVGVAVLERCSRPAGAPPPVQSASATAPTAVAPPCKGPQLKLAEDGGDAGAGNRVTVLSLQNLGAQPCSLTGYPGLTLEGEPTAALGRVRVEQRPGSYFRSGQAPAPVVLAPQAKGYFDLAWNVVPHEGQGETTCPTATRIRVTAPGDTSGLALTMPVTPCGGRVQVSPVRPVVEPAPLPAAPPPEAGGA